MSIIDRNNNLTFKSADYVISDVKRFLKSYDSANALDEGEFPMYIRDVLKPLGRGVMKASEALVKVNGRVISLPEDFEDLYDAYRCRDTTQRRVGKVNEQSSLVLYNDITKDLIYTDKNCCINCFEQNHKVIERVTIKQMVADSECMYNFSYPTPLVLRTSFSDTSFHNVASNEIAIDKESKKLYVNFEDDWVYMRYYAFPLDEYGVPMIPDINQVYQAIKWYIIYQISLSWWWNNDVPDIQNKWQQAESQYLDWAAEASYYVKLPSFGEIMDAAIANKKASLYNVFSNNIR